MRNDRKAADSFVLIADDALHGIGMSGWLNQDQTKRIPKGEYNPWEYGLKEKQEEDRKAKEEKEAKERAEAEEKAQKEREEVERLRAALPTPTGPTDEEFKALLADCRDADAKLGLVKGRAASLFKEGFLEMAAAAYTTAIGYATPPSHTLFGNRSACRCGFGDYEGALDDADMCIKLSPTWAKGYARRGAALHGLFRLDEAVRTYETGLSHDPSLAALKDGLADALRRREAAGGEWTVVVDGAREINTETRKGETMLPQLGHVSKPEDAEGAAHLTIVPAPYRHIVVIDGIHVKLFDLNYGMRTREFNTQYKDAGSKTFDNLVVGACCDPLGRDPALYTVEAGKRAQMLRLLIRDTRSGGDKRENPDKKLEECTNGFRELGLAQPRGLAIVDTSRMAGGGAESTLYVCDSGNGRVLALDPKELDERFAVGRPGSGDGELDTPVAVAAHGDHLAIADAGNYRVCIFTLRGTFIRAIGARPSKFSSGNRAGQFVKPPAHVALAEGHLFVLEGGGSSRVHVLDPQTGEPLGLLHPPFNAVPPSTDVVKAALQAKALAKARSKVSGESDEGGQFVQVGGGGEGDTSGGDNAVPARGCLVGMCVSDDGLFVMSDYGPHPRILRLPRSQEPPPGSPAAKAAAAERAAAVAASKQAESEPAVPLS